MQPSIHIKKVKDRYFDYSVIGPAGACSYSREGLHSIAECLHDAATALGVNFKQASVQYGGVVLGSWLVAKMEHETLTVAAAVHDALARSGQAATSVTDL